MTEQRKLAENLSPTFLKEAPLGILLMNRLSLENATIIKSTFSKAYRTTGMTCRPYYKPVCRSFPPIEVEHQI